MLYERSKLGSIDMFNDVSRGTTYALSSLLSILYFQILQTTYIYFVNVYVSVHFSYFYCDSTVINILNLKVINQVLQSLYGITVLMSIISQYYSYNIHELRMVS